MAKEGKEPKLPPEPESTQVLPGLHYASVRHAANLGPLPNPQKPDSDWGVQEGFHIPTRETRKPLPIDELDKLFKNSISDDAPSLADLKDGLIARCRRAHAEDVSRRRACPKRKKVEEELRKSAADM